MNERLPSRQIILATYVQRFGAYFFDLLGIFLLYYAIKESVDFSKMPLFIRNIVGEIKSVDWHNHRFLTRSAAMLVWIIYSAVMDCTPVQGTFGKRIMNIKVVDNKGLKITLFQSLGRNSFKLVSYAFASLGFLWICIDKKRRGWHDQVASTLVVQRQVTPQANKS